MKAIDIFKNHFRCLEKMVLVFDEYAMYKSMGESKKSHTRTNTSYSRT